MRMFRVPGDHNYQPMQVLNDYDSTKTVHLDLDIKANGDFTYKVTSEGGSENVMSGNMDDWAGGYIGVLTFQTEAELSNIQFTDRTVRRMIAYSIQHWKICEVCREAGKSQKKVCTHREAVITLQSPIRK